MWTYDLINHLMVELETIIALATIFGNKFVRVTSN